MTLAAELAGWDGKATGPLVSLHDARADDLGYFDDLIAGLADARRADAASWLIKYWVEQGQPVSDAVRIWASADGLSGWAAPLHLCQIADRVPPTGAAAPALRRWARSKKAMLRAWSISAFAELAGRDASFVDEVGALISAHLDDPAASVRARLRRVEWPP